MMEKSYSKKIIKEVEEQLLRTYGIKNGCKIAVAVSGGLDSICLLHILKELAVKHDYRLVIVHVNHGIRGVEAKRDEEFVEALAKEYGIKNLSYQVDSLAEAGKERISVEEAARKLRYDCFSQALKFSKAEIIALAHHADDSVETFMMNLARGSGLKGLTGIPKRRGKIIRPLLGLRRRELRKYLEENSLAYVEDSTNMEDEYTRNRVRRLVLPCICENINSKAVEHIGGVIRELDALYEILGSLVEEVKKDVLLFLNRHYIAIDRRKFSTYDFTLASYSLAGLMEEADFSGKDISKIHYRSIYELALAETGKKLCLPSNIEVRNEYEKMIFSLSDYDEGRKHDGIELEIGDLLPNQEKNICFGQYKLRLFRFPYKDSLIKTPDEKEEVFDLSKLDKKLPLSIRFKESRDYMVVDENGSKKKVSRIFIDRKITRKKREELPLIAQGSKVIWISGVRRSRDTWVDEGTKEALSIRIV